MLKRDRLSSAPALIAATVLLIQTPALGEDSTPPGDTGYDAVDPAAPVAAAKPCTKARQSAAGACAGAAAAAAQHAKADFCGHADFYSSSLHGRRTASGAKYDETKLTAAHKHLPFGTKVTVVNRKTGKSCTLTINDRGPFTANRVIDVSKEAAKQLGLMTDKNRMVDCFIRIESKDFFKPRKVAGKEPGQVL